MRVDERVHVRLGERRLVQLVVPVAAVADQLDHDVFVERQTEREREAHDPHTGLRVVTVHVEDRGLDHLGDVGGVHPRPSRLR